MKSVCVRAVSRCNWFMEGDSRCLLHNRKCLNLHSRHHASTKKEVKRLSYPPATQASSSSATLAPKPFSASPIAPVTPSVEGLERVSDVSNGFDMNPSRGTILELMWRNKERKQLSIDTIANELGYTNVYATQLLLMNTPLNPRKARKFQQILELPDSCMKELMKSPHRRFDESISQEPNIYRMLEAVQHNGEAIKLLTNEKFGDGIMSAIDFYISVDKVIGPQGEDRVEIKLNGKFLPFIEQNVDDLVKCVSDAGATKTSSKPKKE